MNVVRGAGKSEFSEYSEYSEFSVFRFLCPSKLGGRGATLRRGYVSFHLSVFVFYHTPSGWLVPLSQRDKEGI